MSEDFVEKFVDDCFNEGLVRAEDICNKVLNEIEEIDKKFLELQALRKRKTKLVHVLKAFGHEKSTVKGRKPRAPMINEDVMNVDQDPSYKDLLVHICDIIEEYDSQNEQSILMRELISRTKFDNIDSTPLYQAVKWLFNQGIIAKNEDRSLSKGVNWDNRPTSNDLKPEEQIAI